MADVVAKIVQKVVRKLRKLGRLNQAREEEVAATGLDLFRYAGIFAPHPQLRPQIIRQGEAAAATGEGRPATAPARRPIELPPSFRMRWHELLKRIFGIDITKCPWCDEPTMKYVGVIEAPDVVGKFLAHLDKPSRAPPLAPGRIVEDWADW